jgi:V8-like Glu-specific endopeptidase
MRKAALVPGLVLSAAAVAACSEGKRTAACSEENSSAIVDGTSASAYAEAVLVDAYRDGKINTACSGALLTPTVVLTAGHCVDTFSGWHVKAPFAKSQTATSTEAETYDWQGAGSETVTPSHHDVGLIYLTAPITLSRYPELAEEPLKAGASVVNIGRIRNGTLSFSDMYVSDDVEVELGDGYGYPYDYATSDVIEGGDSGGPAEIAKDDRHVIVAVNSSATSSVEMLARVDLVLTWIRDQVAAHRAAVTSDAGATPNSDGGATSRSADAGATSSSSAAPDSHERAPAPRAPRTAPSASSSPGALATGTSGASSGTPCP